MTRDEKFIRARLIVAANALEEIKERVGGDAWDAYAFDDLYRALVSIDAFDVADALAIIAASQGSA